MAEYTGANSFGMIGGFNISSAQPIDSRIVVNKIEDVIQKDNWRKKAGFDTEDNPVLYAGLIVSDIQGNVRVLIDPANWNDLDYWKEVGGSAAAEAIQSASDPTVNDDSLQGYAPGQVWINTSTKKAYILIDATAGAAVWNRILDPSDLSGTGIGDMLASVYAKNGGASEGKVDYALVSDKLATPRAISVSGDATGTANFDGSAPANIVVTLDNVGTSGTYAKVTTDAKGRVVSGVTQIEMTDISDLPEFGDVVTKNIATQNGSAADEGKIPTLDASGKLVDAIIPNIASTKVTGLGTAATVNTGTAEGNIPVLGAEGKLDKTLLPQLSNTDITGFGTVAVKDVAGNTGSSDDSGKIPALDANGKLHVNVIPSIALSDVTTVETKAELTQQTAQQVQKGDITIVTEESKTYILAADDPSQLENWKEIKTPTESVSSVNGMKGAVVLTTDNIGEGETNKYYSEVLASASFDSNLAGKTTDNLNEGSTNLYYTEERAKSSFDTNIALASTDNLKEGKSNKYYSETLAEASINAFFANNTFLVTAPNAAGSYE